MKKKWIFGVISVLFLWGIVEFSSYLVVEDWPAWRQPEVFSKGYRDTLEEAASYYYHSDLDIILPKPGKTIVQNGPEFTDYFHASSVRGIGLMDDGINEDKKFKILTIGDSFTRGNGSTDNFKFGWVERVERSLVDTDLVNLPPGGGALQQLVIYNKIKALFDYDTVLVNFFTSGDLIDNLADEANWEEVLKELSSAKERNDFLHQWMVASNYNLFYHYIAHSPVLLPSLTLGLYAWTKYVSKKPPFSSHKRFLKRAKGLLDKANLDRKPKVSLIEVPPRYPVYYSKDGRFEFFYTHLIFSTNKKEMALKVKVIERSADLINKFYQTVKKDGKRFLLTIHPSKEEVYHKAIDFPVGSDQNNYDFDSASKYFISKLDPEIQYLHLAKIYKNYIDDEQLYYKYDGHYNKHGHEVAARYIKEFLIRKGFK